MRHKGSLFSCAAKMFNNKECLYHVINYAHANVVMNKNLSTF